MRKKSLKVIIASAAIVTVLPVSNIRISAENLQSHHTLQLNNTVIGTVKVKVTGLRIRKDATVRSDAAGTAEYGKNYSVYDTKTGDGYTWYEIGENQWIADSNGSWLDYNTVTASSTNTKIGSVKVKVDGLRIRTQASVSSAQAGNAQSGKTYDVYEKTTAGGYTWYRIGENQWIADENGGWTDFTDGSVSSAASASQNAGAKIGNAVVKVNGLRIRSLAGTNGSIVGSAQNGKTYDVYETASANGFTWYRIGVNQWIADQNTNWVAYTDNNTKPAATPAATSAPAPSASASTAPSAKSGSAKVNVYGLNIRNSASTSSARVGQAQYGKTYDVYAVKNAGGYTWYQIGNAQWIAGTSGWVTYTANGSSANTPAPTAAPSTPKATSAPAVVNYIGTARVVVSGLNIRTNASTSASKAGTAVNGRTYNVISTRTNGGYTWYQIGTNQWIADTSGRWIVYNGKGESTASKAQQTAVSKSARNPYYGGWSNCTWGAWQLVYNNLGIALPSMGNAGNWLASAQRLGYATGSTPRVGAVAVYANHVAYVIDYQPFRSRPVEIEEGGFSGGHNIRWVSANGTGTQALRGYIYLK